MKKFLSKITVFFSLFFFSFVAMADYEIKLEGPGTTANAVKAFNVTVVYSGGTVDNNAVTDFSSAGNFDEFQATMRSESKGGKTQIEILVKSKKPDLFTFFIYEVGRHKEIGEKIEAKLIDMGYRDIYKK